MTLAVDEEVYDGLHRVIGRGRISRFVEELVRPHVIRRALESAYREMAADEAHEQEAQEWLEGTWGDVGVDAR